MNYRKTTNLITLIAWRTIAVILFICFISLNNAEAKPLFNVRIDYGATGAGSVAIGDLNGDDNPDLAVTDFWGNKVSVLLGNGDGSFQAEVNYSAGGGPLSLAIGDLNGDGDPDLAVANEGMPWTDLPGNVSVLLGKGDGTFQSAANYSAGREPVSVAIDDFNGDDNLDLVVANQDSDNVSVLLGKGDGTFQSAVNYDAGDRPSSVAIGDLNGDDNLDLAVANVGNGCSYPRIPGFVSVLLGNGDGTFKSAVNYDTGGEPSSLAIGDLNGDDNLDLAVARGGDPCSDPQFWVLSRCCWAMAMGPFKAW